MSYPGAASFRAAGYSPITTNDTYQGGLVRQHGNMSFSRVFEAGHGVTAYQPETVYRIFQRAMFGRDIATGNVIIGPKSNYSSTGPAYSLELKNSVPDSPPPVCFLMDTAFTCAPNQLAALADGSAMVKDFVVISPVAGLSGLSPGPSPSGTNGTTGTSSTPSSKSSASRGTAFPAVALFVLAAVVYFLRVVL
jgi:Serine carboxypeptidase